MLLEKNITRKKQVDKTTLHLNFNNDGGDKKYKVEEIWVVKFYAKG